MQKRKFDDVTLQYSIYGWGGWCVLEGGEEEKLHHYMIFVTFSPLVHEKYLSHQPDNDD